MAVLTEFAFFLVLLGLAGLFAPRALWFLNVGWKLRDAEPSDTYLAVTRIGGGVCCAAAVIFLIAQTVSPTAPGGADNTVLAALKKERLRQISINDSTVRMADIGKLKQWITDARWDDVSSDNTGTYSNQGELDITLADDSEISVFREGGGKFSVGNTPLFPNYRFESGKLESWFSAQLKDSDSSG